jgi:hypothetical protein
MVIVPSFFTTNYNPYSNKAELVRHKKSIQLGESMGK